MCLPLPGKTNKAILFCFTPNSILGVWFGTGVRRGWAFSNAGWRLLPSPPVFFGARVRFTRERMSVFAYGLICACMLSCFHCVWLFATLWTEACQAPLSMRFSRQEYQSGLTRYPPGDLPDPGLNPSLLCLLHCRQILLSHWGSPLFNTYMYQVCILYTLFDISIYYVYIKAETVAVDVLLSLLSLSCVLLFCGHMDFSLPGFSVHGISQVRILEWVAISFSRESSHPRDQVHNSCTGRWSLPLSHQWSPVYVLGWIKILSLHPPTLPLSPFHSLKDLR